MEIIQIIIKRCNGFNVLKITFTKSNVTQPEMPPMFAPSFIFFVKHFGDDLFVL